MIARTDDCTQCGCILAEHISTVTCGNSCRECGKYAYVPEEPSYLYLLTNAQLKLHKIGIGTAGKDKNRLEQLIQAGWSVHGLWHARDKSKTFQWEQEVFNQLEVQINAVDSTSPGFIGRRDRHWVESVSANVISLSELAQLISRVVSGKVK